MTMELCFISLGVIAFVALVGFIYFFIRDNTLKTKYTLKATVLILNSTLLLLSFMTIGVILVLYLNWQDQLTVFIPK